ncbi:hypothetical protein [Hugenholtzia roseola]|uniref:hypothetical protein n=1 Tax=Hugenholtzia roseola TaxID=1002 RepID=UPI0004291037|nr:hypothetical protein [Hugenholtzia roseola]
MKKILLALSFPLLFACGANTNSQAGETTATDSTQEVALSKGTETETAQTPIDSKKLLYLAGFWHLESNPDKKMIISTFLENDPIKAVIYDGTTIEYNGEFSVANGGLTFTYFMPQTDEEAGSLEWQNADVSQNQIIATVEGKKQVWQKIEAGNYIKFSPQHQLMGTWDLDMESDQVRMVFDLERFVENPDDYPQYSQYNTDNVGGRFFPQLYIRSGDCLGEKSFQVSKNQDDFGPDQCLFVSKDAEGKPAVMGLVRYFMGKPEESSTWYVLAFDGQNLTLVEDSNKLLIKFYKKN